MAAYPDISILIISLFFEDVPLELKFEVGGVVWYALRLKPIDLFAVVVDVS